MRRVLLRLAAATLLAGAMQAKAAGEAGPPLAARGGTLVGEAGEALDDAALLGRVVMLRTAGGGLAEVRIEAVQHPPRQPDITLYALRRRDPRSGLWQGFCAEDPAGRALALPMPGRWTPDARYLPPEGGASGTAATAAFHVTCTSGAIGKCALFGYAPWRTGPDGASLAPHFQACVRMLRADYGGDGRGWTRAGTRITWHDTVVHVARPGADAATLPFEAGWGPDGAVCVAHARVPEVADLDAILARYPRLASRAGPALCTEEEARRRGALLFSRSATP